MTDCIVIGWAFLGVVTSWASAVTCVTSLRGRGVMQRFYAIFDNGYYVKTWLWFKIGLPWKIPLSNLFCVEQDGIPEMTPTDPWWAKLNSFVKGIGMAWVNIFMKDWGLFSLRADIKLSLFRVSLPLCINLSCLFSYKMLPGGFEFDWSMSWSYIDGADDIVT